jgi:serine/threonine protein kinase
MTSKSSKGGTRPERQPDRQYIQDDSVAEPEQEPAALPTSGPRKYINLDATASIDPTETLRNSRPVIGSTPKSEASSVHNAMAEHARVANYQIGEMVARGAESVLYKATADGALFCVKAIRNWLGRTIGKAATRGNEGKLEDAAYRSKVRHLENEFQVGTQLQEPGDIPIVRIHALRKVRRLGLEAGYDLLMEYIEGIDLGSKQASRQFSTAEKINFLYQTARALEYMHQRNYIHLDMKPSNVMITDNRVKLIDFGVTVPLGHKPRAVTGTAGFLSPEQIARDYLTQATDLFALGVTFAVVFGASSLRQDAAELKSREVRANAQFLLDNDEGTMLRTIPELRDYPKIAEILGRCTIPRRDRRYNDAGELAEHVRAAAEESGITVRDLPGRQAALPTD